jgi:hypothetical protein
MPAKKKAIKKTIPIVGEPEVEYAVRTSFRSVGNSKGLIISSKLIEASGISGKKLPDLEKDPELKKIIKRPDEKKTAK